MRRRAGVVVLVLSLFAAGIAAGAIHAGPPPPATTTTTRPPTTPATTDVTTTDTTVGATTTVATTTAATTTTTTTSPAPPPKPAGKLLTASPLVSPRCLVVSGFALLEPGRRPLTLGKVAVVPRRSRAADGAVAYPADGSVLTASSVSLSGGGCGTSARARAVVGSLSLFGGAVTIRSVELECPRRHRRQVRGDRRPHRRQHGRRGASREGDRHRPVGLRRRAGAAGPDTGRRAGGSPDEGARGSSRRHGDPDRVRAARAVEGDAAESRDHRRGSQRRRARSAAKAPQVAQKKRPHKKQVKPKKTKRHVRKHRLGDDPLTAQPPLGLTNYVFPVAGVASYGDSYGGYRGDVPGNWHHGDDIFAALGTPVVAVADGTLNRVGWEHLGGWRLWVRDHNRNQFYYAHLSGYSPLALHSKFVKKGDVIGFVGNTGDAFTTPPHVHFEIHPHQLLRLHYNGAVNPTSYIDGWRHVTTPKAPVPVHPPFPAGPCAVKRATSGASCSRRAG